MIRINLQCLYEAGKEIHDLHCGGYNAPVLACTKNFRRSVVF